MIKNWILTLITIMIALSACDKLLMKVQVDHPVVVSAVLPDEGDLFEYTWKFIEIPDSSRLDPDSLLFHARDQEIAFTPDVPGHYGIQVIIWQYNDKIATQYYRYEANNLIESPKGIGELDDNWLKQKPNPISKIIINESVKPESLAVSTPLINERKYSVQMDSTSEPIIADQQLGTQSFTQNDSKIINTKKQMFTIQVASRNTIRSAWDMVEALISDGYDAYIQKSKPQDNGKIWYRVRIGQYNSREAAEKAAETISLNRDLPTWVDFLREEIPEVNKQED